jgi:hypothetical protein
MLKSLHSQVYPANRHIIAELSRQNRNGVLICPIGSYPHPPLFALRNEIVSVLERLKGNKSRTADYLGINRKTIREKMQKYGLEKKWERGVHGMHRRTRIKS